jgi:hypothetical protein
MLWFWWRDGLLLGVDGDMVLVCCSGLVQKSALWWDAGLMMWWDVI